MIKALNVPLPILYTFNIDLSGKSQSIMPFIIEFICLPLVLWHPSLNAAATGQRKHDISG